MRTKLANIDSILTGRQIKDINIDSLLKQYNINIESYLDAYTKKYGSIDFSIDAFLQYFGIEASISIDSLLRKTLVKDLSLDSILSLPGGEILSVDIDSLLRQYGVVFQISVGSLLQKYGAVALTTDSILQRKEQKTVLLDSLVRASELTVAPVTV